MPVGLVLSARVYEAPHSIEVHQVGGNDSNGFISPVRDARVANTSGFKLTMRGNNLQSRLVVQSANSD